MDITLFSVLELIKMLNNKKISSYELTSEFIKKIKYTDKKLNSYITLTEDIAISMAKESDKRRFNNKILGPLDGIPYSLKDNIITSKIRTTCASLMLKDYVPDYDATVYRKLKNNGAVLLGKTNMDEFAMGSSTTTSYFKSTSNPYNEAYVAGGSSGGSAAAVSKGLCAFSLGTDTGGSIRQPASFCGVYGLCPTYGLVSRYGLVSFASSLDCIGPITRYPNDLSIILNTISGYDKYDDTTCNFELKNNDDINLNNIKIGIIDGFPSIKNASSDICNMFNDAVRFFEGNGCEIKKYSIENINESVLTAYYVISSAEASSNLARYDGLNYGYKCDNYDSLNDMYKNTRTEGFGKEVKRRIMLGSFVLSAGYIDKYYNKAMELRKKISASLENVFKDCDVIITPTVPVTAYTKEYASSSPVKLYSDDIFTSFVNLSGLPAVSVPFSKNSDNLPMGIQLIGNKFSESKLIKIAGGIANGI